MLTRFSHLLYVKTLNYRLIFPEKYHTQDMLHFFTSLNNYLQNNKQCNFYKNAKKDTTTVARISHEGRWYVLKRYNFRNSWHAIKLQFRQSRALHSFYYAHVLNTSGISTIKPVAFFEKRWGPFRGTSFFVSEYEEGLTGCVFFKNDSPQKAVWPLVVQRIVELTQELQKQCICHGDYHFGNLLIVDNKPLLLDLDRVKKFQNRNKFCLRLQQKDVENFRKYLRRNSQVEKYFERTLLQV